MDPTVVVRTPLPSGEELFIFGHRVAGGVPRIGVTTLRTSTSGGGRSTRLAADCDTARNVSDRVKRNHTHRTCAPRTTTRQLLLFFLSLSFVVSFCVSFSLSFKPSLSLFLCLEMEALES